MNVGLPSETIKAAASRILELERENAALQKQNEELLAGLIQAEEDMGKCLNEGKLPAWSLDCVRAVISATKKEKS